MNRSNFMVLLLALILGGCSAYQSDWEQPTVALRSFSPLEGAEGFMPGFEIELNVINPNRQALNIEGMSYSISLQGHDLVKGVGKGFPVIEGYSTGVIKLEAQTNLLAGIGLLRELVSGNGVEQLTYEFRGKIDLGVGHRAIRFSEGGDFSMNPRERSPQEPPREAPEGDQEADTL